MLHHGKLALHIALTMHAHYTVRKEKNFVRGK